MSRIFTTSFKSGLLATGLFVLFFDESMNSDSILLFIFSFIIIVLLAFFAILITIIPFQHYFEKKDFTDIQFVKLVFPYYVITTFSLTVVFLITDFNSFVVVIPAFVASISAWFWLFKP